MPSIANSDILFILGSGRSGTSALTRVLSLCGGTLPQSLLGAQDLNPTGFWEPVEAVKLNIEFTARHGMLADPSIRGDDLEIDADDRERYIEAVRSFLVRCPSGPMLLIKELLINDLLRFWLEAAQRAGLTAKAVVVFRHPHEVLASTRNAHARTKAAARDDASQLTIETFNTIWLKTNLLAEHGSRHLPRVFVQYSSLLSDWREQIARVSQALALDLKPDARAIDCFLNPDLHREHYTGAITETFGYSWITRVYAILSAAAQDTALDLASLDEIYNAYRLAARAFRIVSTEINSESQMRLLLDHLDRVPVWERGVHF